MNHEEAKRIGRTPETLTNWLDANCRRAIFAGLQMSLRKPSDPQEFYGHVLARLTLNETVRKKLLLVLARGADPSKFLKGVARNVGREANLTPSIDKVTTHVSDPEIYDRNQPIPLKVETSDYSPECFAEVKVARHELPLRIRRIVREHFDEGRKFEYLARSLSTDKRTLTPTEVQELYDEGFEILRSKLDHLRP